MRWPWSKPKSQYISPLPRPFSFEGIVLPYPLPTTSREQRMEWLTLIAFASSNSLLGDRRKQMIAIHQQACREYVNRWELYG